MLDFIYYPVSFILWVWHKVFGFVFGEDNAIAWVLGIVFLTFTVRGLLFKPFVNQVRSMRKMQDFAPEVKRIQKSTPTTGSARRWSCSGSSASMGSTPSVAVYRYCCRSRSSSA